MKLLLILIMIPFLISTSFAKITEVVYVESPTDTDNDGKPDLIYVKIKRPSSNAKLSTLYYISPYSLGGNSPDMHNVDYDILPQDEKLNKLQTKKLNSLQMNKLSNKGKSFEVIAASYKYAKVTAHSLGTGYSKGCPTVGDMSETLAAKAVIDWLNGRARAFTKSGKEVKATWANGKVGMTGVSYNGTLPIMVAATGVEGLKAIVPIAAISSWYNYYRANGLVVGPGGYIGEDADVLGYYIVRKNACKNQMQALTQDMGRENGDFTTFWQDRDYVKLARNIKAATFLVHGQSDWNVKQTHPIQLWTALEGVAPRRMFLHKGGHGSTRSHRVPQNIQAWFDHFLYGADNGVTEGPQVEVELPNGTLMQQDSWPSEQTESIKFYFSGNGSLNSISSEPKQMNITDQGAQKTIVQLIANPTSRSNDRLIFLMDATKNKMLLSGTAKVNLDLKIINRKAANITVALFELKSNGSKNIITRGWADPQNYRDLNQGELLVPGQSYQMS
ncbi:MAG: X-Pro dipeptidyl-peptidase, partial [Thermoproteota archaeon]